MTGIIEMVHRADHPDGPFKTIREVAEYFERSNDTIRKWCKKVSEDRDEPIPNHKMPLNDEGSAWVWLYTESDIAALADYSEGVNPKGGRPRKVEA